MPRSRYGTTAHSTGPTIANAQVVSTACGMSNRTNSTSLCVENRSGVNSPDGRISMPTIASALAGFWRYTRSK